jgi:hypothetical protein
MVMGGQACVLYGGAEFSRDTDLAVLCNDENLARLTAALQELKADVIAVPPFERRYLEMGLAVHFRCQHPDAAAMHVDVMSKLRGVDEFETLWQRRTTIVEAGLEIDLLSLPDLIRAKKTQRDKDWVMIRRLLEAHYFARSASPGPEEIAFWLREMHTAPLLIDIAVQFPDTCRSLIGERPLLQAALACDEARLETLLHDEEQRERDANRAYWASLVKVLHQLRRRLPSTKAPPPDWRSDWLYLLILAEAENEWRLCNCDGSHRYVVIEEWSSAEHGAHCRGQLLRAWIRDTGGLREVSMDEHQQHIDKIDGLIFPFVILKFHVPPVRRRVVIEHHRGSRMGSGSSFRVCGQGQKAQLVFDPTAGAWIS